MRSLCAALLLTSTTVLANASGALGYSSGPPNNQNCNGCHSGGGAPQVTITGPTTLGAGATGNYTFTVNGGSVTGMNVSVDSANATLNPASASVGLAFGELHQKSPQGSPATYNFTMTAPPFAGTVKIYGTGNACNGNGGTTGDSSASTNITVTITGGSGTNPPVITTPAAPAFNPAVGRQVGVSVGANDDGMESNLSYTWSATGPAPVTFTPNGNNAAKASTANFTKEGMYDVLVTVRDGTNRTATGAGTTFQLQVVPTYTFLRMTPASVQLNPNQTLQYVVSARDQFDAVLATQPTINYSVPFGGSISATGLLKAQGSNGGPFTVVANAMGISTAATFSVGMPPPATTDNVKPTVSLIAPSMGGQNLMPGLMMEANAIDNFGVAEVRFEVATIQIGKVTNGPPWKFTYTTTVNGIPAGNQALEAVAKDINGNEARSAAISVVVPMTATGGGAGGGAGGGTGGGSAAGGGSGTGGQGGAAGGTSSTGGGAGGGGGCSCDAAPFGLGLMALLGGALRPRRRR